MLSSQSRTSSDYLHYNSIYVKASKVLLSPVKVSNHKESRRESRRERYRERCI